MGESQMTQGTSRMGLIWPHGPRGVMESPYVAAGAMHFLYSPNPLRGRIESARTSLLRHFHRCAAFVGQEYLPRWGC